MVTKFKQAWLCTILLDADYGHVKWNNMLSALKYKIDIIPLDAFERQFGYLFDMPNKDMLQDLPVTVRNSKGVPNTIYISRKFDQKIRNSYPEYVPLLKKGCVVLFKTYRRFRPVLSELPDNREIEKHLAITQQFCKTFSICTALTIGDYFKPGMFFAYVEDESVMIKSNYSFRLGEPPKIAPPKRTYFLLKLPM